MSIRKYMILTLMIIILNLCTENIACKKAIIIGASSGMGRELAKQLSQEGYSVGLVARRYDLLQSLQRELVGLSYIKQIDVTQTDAREDLAELIHKMGGLDLMVISISPYLDNKIEQDKRDDETLLWPERERLIDVCFKSFIAQAEIAVELFKKQGYGYLVGITSKAGLRGKSGWPEYSGAKAGVSCYLQGVRNYMQQHNLDVCVTDVIAGYVAVEHSPMGQDPNVYWEISVQDAGEIIMSGIKQRKKIIYVPKKIQLVALVHKLLPDWLYNKYFAWL